MINQTITNYISHHDEVLERLVNEADIPAERLRNAILYSLFPGGKRLRPMLVYLCGEILEVPPNCLDPIAAAIEITHCYSLIHDDLPAMDDDDFRRGKPSCHKAFDEATAILAGDGMQALSIEILLKYLPTLLTYAQVNEVCRELVHASGTAGMVSGQSLDLSELKNPEINEAQLRLIHSLKTGKLISACIKMVIAAARPPKPVLETLISYANYLGLVFQMQDDYLDHYAEDDILGKGRSSDLANEKITFANLYSKAELLKQINQLYQAAKEILYPFGEQAANLLALTDYLHRRT
ncbi:Farnesyl diphosphate synthase [Legionella massiliensis]|uniref:Farnesyl diphosphate synthase n=1 Tax=Legionella massiliensis TaxID=1034943 RepID=A0A078KXL6_9GAMM|nr:farnesyl diphosphate synthase [Legionella massiliensis]CDZ77721.1 Farnesyl diphosphate synthase [Legionella massiliensis]CEE13459.1 Farnesyl diphosphate synthase [Legionella massiliensis]